MEGVRETYTSVWLLLVIRTMLVVNIVLSMYRALYAEQDRLPSQGANNPAQGRQRKLFQFHIFKLSYNRGQDKGTVTKVSCTWVSRRDIRKSLARSTVQVF